ncbi:16451_t:CDS:2 [Acaulospora morrowiae]|uniref:16451_t:CDS:1 n=1 Tax=Acaulospora morrowiae TaxID=94023 RepID=A0A9N8ZE37_9GLOM|nr:16451_t:CDS:2 [Acaulospora morrowiae]
MLCGSFRKLLELDAEDQFENIIRNTTVEIDIPKDIKEYLHDLFSEILKVHCKSKRTIHGLQIDSNEKLGPTKYGEIENEAHKDGIYTTNVDQNRQIQREVTKTMPSHIRMIIYKKSIGATEFDSTHYMGA